MTSASHNTEFEGTPEVVPAGEMHPLLVLYLGKRGEIVTVRSSVEDRLQGYVSSGVVLGGDIPSDGKHQNITDVSLPTFDEFIGIHNKRRYDTNGADLWSAQHINSTEIRVLVCALDASIKANQLQSLYELVQGFYIGRGLDKINISLLWVTEQSVQIAGSKGAQSYIPQLFVNPKRLNDTLSVVADTAVNWATTNLMNSIVRQIGEIQTKNKSVKAVWLSTATIYVDLPFVMQALFERVTHRFMFSWRSNPVNPNTADEIQTETRKQASYYQDKVSESICHAFHKLGWQLNSTQLYVYRQTFMSAPEPSGFPQVDSPIAKGLFANAASWWLGQSGKQITSLLKGFVSRVRMAFTQPFELNIADKATMIEALRQQYYEAHVQMRDGLAEINEKIYGDLQAFFFTHLNRFDQPNNPDYGLKRMLTVIEKYTQMLDKSIQLKFYKQITGKTEEITQIPSLHEDYLSTLSTEHAEQLNRLQLKWARERGSMLSLYGILIRAVVLFPLLLSLLYAYTPAYFVDGPAVGILLASTLVLLSVVFYVWSFLAYFSIIARDRDRYFAEYITPTILGIAAYYAEENRRQLILKLLRLHSVYQEIDITIDKQNTTAVIPVTNIKGTRHFIIRDLDMVYGNKTIVVDDTFQGEQWEVLRNEEAYIYERMGVPYLSWHSQVKFYLNKRSNLHQKAEVTLLFDFAEKLYSQRRQSDTALKHLSDKINEPISQIISGRPISLDEVVELVDGLQRGSKWCWMSTQAKIDAVPRDISGFEVQKYSHFTMQDPSATLAGASGQVSRCFALHKPHSVLETRLSNEMSRIELEFDIYER